MYQNNILRRYCDMCAGEYEENDWDQHKNTEKHRFNYLLYVYNTRKKRKVQNHNGFEFTVKLLGNVVANTTTNHSEMLIVKITPENFQANSNELRFEVKVINMNGLPADCEINILHPHGMFTLEEEINHTLVTQGKSFKCTVKFKVTANVFGSIKLPIGIVVTPLHNPIVYFNIYREILIVISNNPAQETFLINNPFQKEKFTCKFIHPATSNRAHHFTGYEIEDNYKKMMYMGLKEWSNITIEEYLSLNKVTKLIDRGLTKENYMEFFKFLLWLEEAAAVMGLEQYNMSNVTLKLHRDDEVELEVPGLAEKRPSILPGDTIIVRMDEHYGYTGIVKNVIDKSVFITNFDEELILFLQDEPDLKWFVKFEISRLQLVRMHSGVNRAGANMLRVLFPEPPVNRNRAKVDIKRSDLINRGINEEQFKAVVNIVSGTSQHAPYIVFGPPGTGKTVTIVEAILQIAKRFVKKQILVCAPSNAACDMLARKLDPHCTKGLLRLHTTTRDPATIPRDIKSCSNLIGEDFLTITSADLNKYKIIISTLHLIGKYSDGYTPDVLFIDEAAQATEPECDIAISLMNPKDLIVLAGDPKQLGPVCSSNISEQKGLGTSLLERLMDKNDLYKKHRIGYDDNYITMLVQNYRSHEQILTIPNECFYDNALISKAQHDALSDFSISRKVCGQNQPNDNQTRALEFCGILSKEDRTGYSPSYFNDLEKETVISYVKVLMEMKRYNVTENDIGIIAPYIRQVQKIKQDLAALNLQDIEVGTTEAFQGSEKRIMLISTVRAQHSLLKYDRKYQLGFVSNERRFNVAITRAKSKLIIIGNPYCLGYNKNWLTYIDHCTDLDSYSGIDYFERTSEIMQSITQKINLAEGSSDKPKRKGKKKRR